jgi:hypothetical protein
MVRRLVPALLATAAVLAAGGPNPADACACGVALQAKVDAERALVVHRGETEDLVVSYDLRAAGKRPAVVIPVPAEPRVKAIDGADPLVYLDGATTPVQNGGGGDGAPAPMGSPEVKRSIVGGYAVTRLHGDDSRAIDRWLRRNGYALPAGAEPMLRSYVRRGWWFVALRLAKREGGALKPLKITFAAGRPVYPMRLAQLGRAAVDLDLYVVARDRVRVAPLQQEFSGAVADLPSPPDSVRALLDGRTLTKLVARSVPPKAFTKDLYPVAVEAPTPSEVVPLAPPAEDDDGAGDGTVLVVGAVAAMVAALALTGWRTRRRTTRRDTIPVP